MVWLYAWILRIFASQSSWHIIAYFLVSMINQRYSSRSKKTSEIDCIWNFELLISKLAIFCFCGGVMNPTIFQFTLPLYPCQVVTGSECATAIFSDLWWWWEGTWGVSKNMGKPPNHQFFQMGWFSHQLVIEILVSLDEHIWMFPKIGVFPPQIINFNRVFHYFLHPFWGVKSPYFWFNTHMIFRWFPTTHAAFDSVGTFGGVIKLHPMISTAWCMRAFFSFDCRGFSFWMWWSCKTPKGEKQKMDAFDSDKSGI